jgi:hypothetical protein
VSGANAGFVLTRGASAFVGDEKHPRCPSGLVQDRAIWADGSQREFVPLTVRIEDSRTEMWELTVERDSHDSCRTLLMAADGTHWRADGPDILECLFVLRNQVEPYGFRLCCNASRRDS